MALASIVNFILGSLTLIAVMSIIGVSLALILGGKETIQRVLGARGVFFAFSLALVATLGSLVYSDILGYEPCKLCWIQRIFMYPVVLLLGLALWGKHKGNLALIDASILLSIGGGLFALYHNLLQLGLVPAGLCIATGSSVSCAERFVLQFGFVTIPLMSLAIFLSIILFLTLGRTHGERVPRVLQD